MEVYFKVNESWPQEIINLQCISFSLAQVIACVTSLSPIKSKSNMHHFDMYIVTLTGSKGAVCFDQGKYALLKQLNDSSTHGVLIK